MAYSKRLAEVLGEPDGVLADVSGGKAALRVARSGGEISAATVINVKSGQYGRDGKSVSILARAYAAELLAKFGDEIEEKAGERTPEAAEQWLLWCANPRLSSISAGPSTVREALENVVQLGRQKYARELEYASEEEAGPILQFTGQTDIPDHDRALLEEAYRIMEAEHRAKHGPHE